MRVGACISNGIGKGKYCLTFVLLCVLTGVAGQTLIRTERLTTQEGLANHWIFGIMQDSKGYIWLSTYDGLQRYDGNAFKVFRPSQKGFSFPITDRVQWAEERDDGMFLVSAGGGLLRFDPNTEIFDSIPQVDGDRYRQLFGFKSKEGTTWRLQNCPSVDNNYPTLSVNIDSADSWSKVAKLTKPSHRDIMLAQVNPHAFWFWSHSTAYYRLDRKTWELQTFPIAGAQPLLPVDRAGKLWYVKEDQPAFIQLPQDVPLDDWSSVFFDNNVIWLFKKGKSQSIYRLDPQTTVMEEIATGTGLEIDNQGEDFVVYDICEDREGNLWLAHFQGIVKLQRNKRLFDSYLSKPIPPGDLPPVGFSTRSITEGGDETLYVLENGGQVNRVNLKTRTAQVSTNICTTTLPTDLIDHCVSVMHWGNDLWIIVTDRHRLVRVSSSTGDCKVYNIPAEFNTTAIGLVSGSDRIWLAGSERLIYFDPVSENFGIAGDEKGDFRYTVFNDDKLVIWGMRGDALIKVNPADWTRQETQIFDDGREVRSVIGIGDDIWLGTSRGLLRVNAQTYETKSYSTAQGLAGNFIYSMIADGDYLWIGTSDGLSRFNMQTEQFSNFLLGDGLPHYEFNSLSTLKTNDGRIYMGTLNGFIGFDPAKLETETKTHPRMLWSGFRFLEKESETMQEFKEGQLNTDKPIIIAPAIRNFTIDMALTSYASPRLNQYAWRMDGLDDNWNYMGNQSSVVYHQLPAGHYTFHAKGADPSGNWSENVLSIPIVVLRPWYARWWAYLMYALVLGGVILWFYRFQLGRRLQHAENQRLRELDTFKSQFFANITHEFRTPLTVILGSAERAEQRASPEVRNSLSLIKRNGQNLLRLINQILDLSKLENDKLEMQYVQGDILAYVRYIVESLHSLANAKNVLVRVESGQSSILMDYDPERLLYIIHNLLSNAIKFTGSGGVVRIQVDFHTKHQLQLRVVDNGIGIAQEDLPRIFDRFYQVKGQDQPQTGGSGIGLALTKELVNAMDGTIAVESAVGKGTTFTIVLPITRHAPLQTETIEHVQPQSQNDAGEVLLNPDNPELLIIEDNPDVVEYLRESLQERYTLQFAYNGRAGIDLALEKVPDIILSDVMMPEKDGFEVVETLKNDERTSHIPIVLLTARAEIESRIAGLRKGADAYLAKPFHQEELEVTLIRLLETRRKLQERYSSVSSTPLPVNDANDTDVEDAFVTRIRAYFEENLANADLTLEDTCKAVGMNRTNLNQKLKALTGNSPMQLLQEMRLYKAKDLLAEGRMNVSEVAFEVGFNDPKYFSRAFSKTFGQPPSQVQ